MPVRWARVGCSDSSRSKSWFSGSAPRVVLDPGEERIKSEFTGVKCTMLPMHSILRIDEVKKQGAGQDQRLRRQQRRAISRCRMYTPAAATRRQEIGTGHSHLSATIERVIGVQVRSPFCTIRALHDRAPRRPRSLRFPHRKTAPRARSHSSRHRRHQRALRPLRRSRRAISTRANARCSSAC